MRSVSATDPLSTSFNFYNSEIFAFIDCRDKRRIIEACSILYSDTILQRQVFFFLQNVTFSSKNNAKRFQNPFIIFAPFSRHLKSKTIKKGNNLPLWDEVEIIDRAEQWRIRRLKESAHLLSYNDLLSRPSIEMNTIWEPIIKTV